MSRQELSQVFPKSFGKSQIATPHGREWTWSLLVLLSVQCSMQTSSITQPTVCYIHIAQTDTWRWHIQR